MADAAWADLSSLAHDMANATGTSIGMAAAEIIQQSAQQIQKAAQTAAPVKSGRLRSSISIRYPEPLHAVIGPQVEYGVYQEFGTGSRGEFPGNSYEIKPKSGHKYLSFVSNGRRIYVRKVTHPGVKAHPFMRPAFRQVLGSAVEDLASKGAALITKGPNA
jgi:HK97 gp10 family phage protein